MTEKSIFKELDSYHIPVAGEFTAVKIKLEADRIYKTSDIKTTRGKNRKHMIFFCLYNAYKEHGLTVSPDDLMYSIDKNYKKKDINDAISKYSKSQTGYSPKTITESSPLDYLPDICRKLGLEEDHLESCKILAEKILSHKATLKDENPQKVASAIFQYYLAINGHCTDERYAKQMKLSPTTLNSMYKEISNIHNSYE